MEENVKTEATPDVSQIYNLEIENELRILVGDQSNVQVELTSGLAEIYGTEMVLNQVYTFPSNSSIAVFTWYGCAVRVKGKPESASVIAETPMILKVVLHASLEERRIKAETENTRGPITLVVGPIDVGKSTLCRLLLNYAARLGRRPLYIDLDVGQNSISIPGTIGVLTIEKPADVVTGFEDQTVQVYQFGFKSPGHNIALYFLLLKKLGQTLQTGLRQASRNVRSSGVIINSCGWVRSHGYNAITLTAMSFEVDIVCVLEEERLYSQLKRDMPANVNVIFIPKLGGAVERSRQLRSQTRDARVREYFYGVSNQLHPFSFEINFSDVQVYKVSQKPLNEEADYMNVTLGDVDLLPVSLGPQLVNQVLGLSFSETATEDIMLTNVIGFICVTHINMNRGTATILSPQPGPLPKKIFLMGDIRLTDQLSN